MEEKDLKEIIEREYDIEVKTLEKIKNTYRINGCEGYCLKIIKYEYPHFCFICSAINHLIKNGLETIIPFKKTKSGLDYIKVKNNYCYLTKWVPSRVSNYSDLDEVKRIAKNLANLHKASEGFIIRQYMKPRVYWMSWINTFNTRKNEILDFENRISQKAILNDFDKKYRDNIKDEIERANRAIKGLENSKYREIMGKHIMNLTFCHHDLANHNILIDNENNIKFIDFDYCILDSHLHDLASFILRVSKSNNYNIEVASQVLDSYSEIIKVDSSELNLVREFLRFPQEFWQLGIQAYWEMQPWSLEKFNFRLDRYLKEIEKRENFIDNFFDRR